MLLTRWRARRALATRSAPSDICDPPDGRLTATVEELRTALGALESLGDPIWHHRWEGELQLVGLDARRRAVADVRQRLARTAHEVALRHMARRGRRVVAVVYCAPEGGEGLEGWYGRLLDDQGEVGGSDWRHVRKGIAVALFDEQGGRRLFGGDAAVRAAFAQAGWTT